MLSLVVNIKPYIDKYTQAHSHSNSHSLHGVGFLSEPIPELNVPSFKDSFQLINKLFF